MTPTPEQLEAMWRFALAQAAWNEGPAGDIALSKWPAVIEASTALLAAAETPPPQEPRPEEPCICPTIAGCIYRTAGCKAKKHTGDDAMERDGWTAPRPSEGSRSVGAILEGITKFNNVHPVSVCVAEALRLYREERAASEACQAYANGRMEVAERERDEARRERDEARAHIKSADAEIDRIQIALEAEHLWKYRNSLSTVRAILRGTDTTRETK